MVNFGTVKGFLNYATYMRGKEEMAIIIVNEPQVKKNQGSIMKCVIAPENSEKQYSSYKLGI